MSSSPLKVLFDELRRRRWTLHLFGRDKEGPDIYAATFQWETCADVFILRDQEDAVAFRTPTFPDTDVFLPRVVNWQYLAPAEWTLRAVLTIGAPGQADAPFQVLTPHPKCSIPIEDRRPVTIRPTGLYQNPASGQTRS